MNPCHRPRRARAPRLRLAATWLAVLPPASGLALTPIAASAAAAVAPEQAAPPPAPAAATAAPADAAPEAAAAPVDAASSGAAPPPGATPAAAAPAAPSEIESARRAAEAAGVSIVDLKVGQGEPVGAGAYVRVHYTGWLQDAAAPDGKGKKFDSSRERREPFLFTLGAQRVIRGWDLGVAGMQRGGKRRLVIPDTLAYGARGASGLIPPHATLVFDIELIDFRPPLKPAQ